MKSLTLVVTAFICLLALSYWQERMAVAQAATKPNIVLIVADDLGYGDLGCYGQKSIQTPVLDQFAADGMRFTNHYAGSTVCAPSRSTLMTGLHTGHSPIRGNREIRPMGQQPLPAGTITTAKILQEAGYRTGLIGKWGLGGPGSSGEPNRQGFDYFYGYLCQRHAHNYYPEFLFRNTARVPLQNVLPEPKRPDGAGVAIKRVQYSADLIAREAVEFVHRNKDRPFFLAFTATLPHANNEAGSNGMEVPDFGIYADKDWPDTEKGFAAMVTRLDSEVGNLLGRLEADGIADNTLVMFTSDNGAHNENGQEPEFFDSNGELRGIKEQLYEGGIRVPLIARWPGKIQAGSTSDLVSAFWDYLPTFAELAGVKPPPGLDGISVAPTLLGEPARQRTRKFLYWEFHQGKASMQAVRMKNWKAVRLAPGATLELYDLATDPGEQHGVAADHPDIVRQIEAYLKTARTESKFWHLHGGNLK